MSPPAERTSLLTRGLEPLGAHSRKVRDLLDRLYAMDDELQDAHFLAKRDDEYGENVVRAYKKFLALRQILIDELEREKIAVPWQMRMRIDDIELTLHQRKEKLEAQNGKAKTTEKIVNATDIIDSGEEAPLPPATSRERRIVTLLVPSLVVLFFALLWYQWFS